jgi:integrase
MSSIYTRGKRIWMRYKNAAGVWESAKTRYLVGDEEKARRQVREVQAGFKARAEAGETLGVAPGQPVTVRTYGEQWLRNRRALGLTSAPDDSSRLKLHAFPVLGDMALDEVRPRLLRDLVLAMRTEDRLAPRTIRHVYTTLGAMFRTAVADELIQFTPCVVARGILPKKADKDPAWRAQAIYTRQEVETLISDNRIPQDRRVLYALDAVAGLRHGEAAGLRWGQYDEKAFPLGALNLAKTKTGVPRSVPVHPTLARILAEWKLAGWERTYGRMPTPDDFITPTRNMTARTAQESPKQLHEDQDLLGLRRRRGHDLHRTFITLARVDGARSDLLQTITHGPRGDIMNMYTTFPWPTLCEEVAKLKIDVLEGKVLDGDFGTLATSLATSQLRGRTRWQKVVTPSGLEPEITP